MNVPRALLKSKLAESEKFADDSSDAADSRKF
jgi:hypothetical protein